MRVIVLSWLAAFVVLFGSNAIFHTFGAAGLYDPYLSGVTLPMAQANPVLVAMVDAVLAAAMAYFLFSDGRALPVRRLEAAKAGAVVGLVGAWTYNLVNSALIPSWPVVATIVDVAWHVMLGATAGTLMASVHGALVARSRRPA
jgi:uncharacterized membrane protein